MIEIAILTMFLQRVRFSPVSPTDLARFEHCQVLPIAKQEVLDFIQFACRRRQCERWSIHEGYWRRMETDAQWCYNCWSQLNAAQTAKYHSLDNIDTRAFLNDLRRLLGDEAYCSGRMPPPLPIWLFRSLD